MKKIIIVLVTILLTSTKCFSACDVSVNGFEYCGFDLTDYYGFSSAPAVSSSGTGRIYFDLGDEKLKCSENGGAFTNCVGAGSSYTDADARAAVGWTDGGTNVFVTTSTDNVGIGTSQPMGKFGIWGNGTTTDVNTLWRDSAGTSKVIILDNGNVGIGSTFPSKPLDVNGAVALSAGSVSLPSIAQINDANNGWWFPAADTQAWSTGGSERMRLNSSGNVGIGTVLQTHKLELVSTTISGLRVFNNNNTASSSGGAGIELAQFSLANLDVNERAALINVSVRRNGTPTFGSAGSLQWVSTETQSLNSLGTAFDIFTTPSGGTSGTRRLRVAADGNVGIGTASPVGKLAVVGDEVRIWTGAGTVSRALSSGELYVEGDLEVDGVLYGDGGGLTQINSAGGWTNNLSTILQDDSAGGSVGIGTYQPSDVRGKLDVRGDEVRIWAGTGSSNQALSSGELYVQSDLEVDGSFYAHDIFIDGVQGITNNTSYWLCTDALCTAKCQVTIVEGSITGCP